VRDIEPRSASGDTYSSQYIHTRIALPVDISFNLADGVNLLIDDKNYMADSSGIIRLKIPAGDHKVEAITPIGIRTGERLVFDRWSDAYTSTVGQKELRRNICLERPSTYSAIYRKQYFLNLTTPDGQMSGSEWFDAGSKITIAMRVPMSGAAGLLGGAWVFDHWHRRL